MYFKPENMLQLHSPEMLGLTYCSAQRLVIHSQISIESQNEELCLIVIKGSVSYISEDGTSGTAAMCDQMYVPLHSRIILQSHDAIVMRYGCPCSEKYNFAHISFTDVDKDERHKIYGKAEEGSLRDCWNFITKDFPSGRFLTGMCRGRKGGWTAWPPHEHGAEREEVYCYFDMKDNFGIQCVYTDFDHPNVYMVREGDFVSIPEGYHPNCGIPHGEICYAFVMVSTKEGDREFMDLRTQKIYGDKLE